MITIDEIRVCDDGEIDVCIIPPDDLSTAPFLQRSFNQQSQVWSLIHDLFLRRIARELELNCEISGLVHGGEDRYTFITSDGDYLEIDTASKSKVATLIRRISTLLENEMLSHANKMSSDAIKPVKRKFHPVMNRLKLTRSTKPAFNWTPRAHTSRKGQELNHLSRQDSKSRLSFRAPNRFVGSAS